MEKHVPLPPLAERVRPQSLEEYTGQTHLTGPNGPLRALLAQGTLPSMILWGPPGVGKTTLVRILAHQLNRPLHQLSAIQAGVKEVRAVLEMARMERGTLLFIDEIHRFNKAQQDALLQAVEEGTVTLIGATTENPSFEVIPALLSRSQVYVLQALSEEDIRQVLTQAIRRDVILQQQEILLEGTGAIFQLSGGDARKALGLLELVVSQATEQPVRVTDALVLHLAQQKVVLYDKNGEQHYDVISAFIKSLRGSDPNGAVYWLARMLEAGEDVRFIARRMVILASEDIGNAQPNALLMATTTFQAVERVGMPESRIILSQCATYLATCPKSNAAYLAIGQAQEAVRKQPNTPVPLHLRNAPTRLMKQLDYSKGYKYSHDHEGVAGNQQYLPEGLEGTAFYQPKPTGKEAEILRFLKDRWNKEYGY
ncbi:MAG: replication-associated recombination protein A [Bacteroidetes bacterium]|nr:replication-associated recombination protein A [Bacteroidota bacterium]